MLGRIADDRHHDHADEELVMPNASAAGSTEPTRISLIQASRAVAPASISTTRRTGHCVRRVVPFRRLSGKQLLVRPQREQQVHAIADQQDDRNFEAQAVFVASPAGPAR